MNAAPGAGRAFRAAGTVRAAVLGGLLLLFGLLLARPIDLLTADLGRHLKNGEIILRAGAVPRINLYSYTHPSHPFLNHHWGTGVVFSLAHRAAGFAGISALCVALALLTFLLFFDAARRFAGFYAAAALSAVAIPLAGSRVEARPEVFTALFCGLYLWLLWGRRDRGLPAISLALLPVLQVLWVNLHIYFFLGPLLVLVFLADAWIPRRLPGPFSRGPAVKALALTFSACTLACLANPAGLRGAVYPFRIFEDFGYRLFENQTFFFIEKLFGGYPPAFWFKAALATMAASWGYALVRRRPFDRVAAAAGLLTGAMAFLAVRNFALFGYFWLPAVAAGLAPGAARSAREEVRGIALAALAFLAVFLAGGGRFPSPRRAGLGLQPGTEAPARFFKENALRGPVFNNYDVGGYLIYHLYPNQGVFVDNRPEAYPSEFFRETYVPMQEDPEAWRAAQVRYGFNTVFFSLHDMTPWGQAFLARLIDDPGWAPVFTDGKAIIFLRRGGPDQGVIDRREIPRGFFHVTG